MFTACRQGCPIAVADKLLPDGFMERLTMRFAYIAPIVLCLALAACASSGDEAPTIFTDPGKFQYYNCEQLATSNKSVLARQKALQTLIDKAGEGAAGTFVGAIAYKTDYISTTEDLRLIKAAIRDKNCAGSPTWLSNTAIR
jgi:hypothetical protein